MYSISFKSNDHYFGRNLDLEFSYHETITITPRNYPFHFRHVKAPTRHLVIIGIAYVNNDYPLYHDAVNEVGLGMAGLNFPQNAVWQPYNASKNNISPFELIPWILGFCKTVDEACTALRQINPLNEAFADTLPLSPLHWLLAVTHEQAPITTQLMKIKLFTRYTSIQKILIPQNSSTTHY